MFVILTAVLTLMIGFVGASMGEWSLHLYVMHRSLWIIRFPHRMHAGVHHDIFGSGTSYHLQSKIQATNIPMAWWACFVLVPLATLPFCVPTGVLMLFSLWHEAWTALACGFFVAAGYFGTYEYLHWCMHVPKNRWFERLRLFRWLKEHHRLHHLSPEKNANVVLPIADLIFGTRRRQKAHFAT